MPIVSNGIWWRGSFEASFGKRKSLLVTETALITDPAEPSKRLVFPKKNEAREGEEDSS